jgi:hypothetical protein
VAGRGVLLKAHSFASESGSELHNLMPRWDDVQATHVTTLADFPGKLDSQGALGVASPGLVELSGILALLQPGEYALALQCSGACALYLFGVASLNLRMQ